MMQFTADFDDGLEKTQNLPILISATQREELSRREHAEQNQIVELTRENLRQAKEIAQLRGDQKNTKQPAELDLLTEARFFEICGGLKDALTKVSIRNRRSPPQAPQKSSL